ncbi:hypothetical protein EH223_06865 [candidate division KSB1 bacterium]|nr:hypothetical protein [candidate division KSB1 bacterium]RQW04710.1 MAG: hypothetical protein EH223_06865 [candidate division KSB1 bacterium]
MKRYLLGTALLLALLLFCARNKLPEDALIQVGDKHITTKEFLYRGEFTTHPNFPRHDRNLEKMLLNNLIMEKLFVLEHGEESELAQNENFHSYIKGIQEQKMRERLFYEKAYNTVQLDSNEINKRYILSQREYDLEFYSIYDDSIARAFRNKVQANPDSALQIFNNAWDTDQRPTWSVKWKDPDHVNIHEALYSSRVAVDSVIGPIPLDHGQWIWMKVVNWKDVLLMGGFDAELRHKEVIEKTTLNKATLAWDAYMREVMRGKEIKFDVDVFKKMADFIFDMRAANDPEAKDLVMQRFWQVEDSTLTVADLPTEEAILQQPFFTIDGVTWTVADFRQAVASHPLVYRKQVASKSQFYEQFRIAVADLVRDHYLNKEAYTDGLDKDVQVQRTVEMWHDALLATYERDQTLKRLGAALPDTTDPYRQQKLQKAFNDYLQELRTKYHDIIKVNMEEFEKLELSKTQLFVMQNRVPYPIAVPSWPMFSTGNKVDYAILNSKK